MKALVLALFSVASFGAFAETYQTQTVMSVVPSRSVTCANHDYTIVNQIGAIERVSETPEQVTFRFHTRLGKCQASFLSFYQMSPAPTVSINKSIGRKVTRVSNSVAEIELTFDKSQTFKHRNHAKYTMLFMPYGMQIVSATALGYPAFYGYQLMEFWWKVEVTEVTPGVTSLAVQLVPRH